MKKIKVLHISETFAAGVYTYIKDICQFSDTMDSVITSVIYSGEREDTDFDKFEKDFPKATELIQIPMTREITPIKDFKASINIIKKLRKIKPDVIHLHSSKAGVIGRIAAKFYPKAKVYYTPNGYAFLREDVSSIKKRIFKNIEKYIAACFGGTTIACGDTEYEHAKKLGKALLVRNGVSIDDVHALKRAKTGTDFVVGTMGRLSPQKNPKLFNDIAEKFPLIKFIWIGDGELRKHITAENITIMGWMPREKALDLVNEFDIYIQTSLWEGLPFTIIEAMILERPIVANNVIGNKDAVSHNENGYLCNSTENFEKAIQQLINDQSLKLKMGEQSHLIAKKLFDRNQNFKTLLAIYQS